MEEDLLDSAMKANVAFNIELRRLHNEARERLIKAHGKKDYQKKAEMENIVKILQLLKQVEI